ncbi:MAG: hypothetical protein EA411_07255 [Saprospirales bacterium]|nr:MAG: hypothetical protein EA411_07255 [Saprospirales bacterium]
MQIELKLLVACFLFSGIVFGACQKSGEKTIDRYTEEELTELIVDISIARAAVAPLPNEKADSVRNVYYEQIAEIRGMEVSEINTILEELSRQPDRLRFHFQQAADSIRARN